MRDKLHAYLLERPSGATARELLDLIFTRPGADAELGPRLLETMLAGDGRFTFQPDTRQWIATRHAVLQRDLREASFVVVDLETTGGSPERGDRIIEIGAVRIRGGRVVERFAELVDPERSLPPFITRLTGITPDMLAGRRPIRDVIGRFERFAAGDVLIAHNARFDVPFLSSALRTAAGRGFDQPCLCTLRLARRALPLLRRRSLDSLAAHFGIPVVDRHRALGDALMTAEVFFHLLERLRARGVVRVGEALDLQEQAADGRRFTCPLPRGELERLPRTPGIYRFFDENGRLLYVGKAKNLRRRVRSYLTNAAAHSRKTLDLVRHLHAVRAEEAGSELEAALNEADEIRRAKPPYNKLRKHLPRIAFLKLALGGPYPRLLVTARLSRGKARFFGPFHGRPSALRALDLLTRLYRLRTCAGRLRPDPSATPCLQGQIGACSVPCRGAVDEAAYGQQVAALLALFDGDTTAARAAIEARRRDHAEALRFEAAERAQHDLRLLRQLERRSRTMGWVLDRQNFVALQPAADGDSALLYVALHGRLVERHRVRSSAELGPIAAAIAAALANGTARVLGPEDVDATTIFSAWLRDRGEKDGYVFPLGDAASIEGQLPEWVAALDSLLAVAAHADGDAAQLPAPGEAQGER
jgi:DNA polymerase-3 subunit epsilon